MDEAAFPDWLDLHLRAAHGEALSDTERGRYEAGLRDLHELEVLPADSAALRTARAAVASLEAEQVDLR